MDSSLQFNKFKVLEMKYIRNLQSEEPNGEKLEPLFEVNIGTKEDDINKAVVNLSVEIGDEDTSYEYVYVEILGFFEFNNRDNFQPEEIKNFYKVNGTAILFPYLRTLVSDLTSKGDESPIILPTINVNAFFEDENENKEDA